MCARLRLDIKTLSKVTGSNLLFVSLRNIECQVKLWEIMGSIYEADTTCYGALSVLELLNICDCLSENRPSSHLPVFQEIPF